MRLTTYNLADVYNLPKARWARSYAVAIHSDTTDDDEEEIARWLRLSGCRAQYERRTGKIYFHTEKDRTMFLLRFSGSV